MKPSLPFIKFSNVDSIRSTIFSFLEEQYLTELEFLNGSDQNSCIK